MPNRRNTLKCVSRCPLITLLPVSPGRAVPCRCPGPNARTRPESPASTTSDSRCRSKSSRATGVVSGADNVGGLVGVNTDALVENSFATGTVQGTGTNVGGLVGFNSQSRVRSSFATGAVTGKEAVGGLIGRNNGAVRNVYSTAANGLIGDNAGGSLDTTQ